MYFSNLTILGFTVFKRHFQLKATASKICDFRFILQKVIVAESRNLIKGQQNRQSTVLRNNRLLVLNLAAADLLMGFYLLILGGAGAFYNGEFCTYRVTWLTSGTCSFMGVLVVISSETSVLTLVLLTAARLYGVYKASEII